MKITIVYLKLKNQILYFDVQITFLHFETVFPYSKFKNTCHLNPVRFCYSKGKLNYGIDITP